MDMKIIKSEKCLCTCCMEEHEVKEVVIREKSKFKNKDVCYDAIYMYCELTDEFYMNEQQMKENDISLKNAYRREEGLLTSDEIAAIRAKYRINQKDLCTLLGWGEKTITRYESHQVQDKAHDTILKKLSEDPEWFLILLNAGKENISKESYEKILETAKALYETAQDSYLRKAIEANYIRFRDNKDITGNTRLSLNKVIDVIRYFAASTKIKSLYKVKLMKLIWYADALSYKDRGHAITGLAYEALPMGAVPIGHNAIINLKAIPCEEIEVGDGNAYYFHMTGKNFFPYLDDDDIEILDRVIGKLGGMNKNEIIDFMHKEQAYIKTKPRDIIQFKYSASLQI